VLLASWEVIGNVHFESLTTKAIYGRVSNRSTYKYVIGADTEFDCMVGGGGGGLPTNIFSKFRPSIVINIDTHAIL
jgi:hypothetical protein